jgi:hypothetical protein
MMQCIFFNCSKTSTVPVKHFMAAKSLLKGAPLVISRIGGCLSAFDVTDKTLAPSTFGGLSSPTAIIILSKSTLYVHCSIFHLAAGLRPECFPLAQPTTLFEAAAGLPTTKSFQPSTLGPWSNPCF